MALTVVGVSEVAYDVQIRKTATGEVRACHFDFDWFKGDHDDLFWWTEGNFSCDCNRELEFERAGGADPDVGSVHCGKTAFTAIKAILPDGQEILIDGDGQGV